MPPIWNVSGNSTPRSRQSHVSVMDARTRKQDSRSRSKVHLLNQKTATRAHVLFHGLQGGNYD